MKMAEVESPLQHWISPKRLHVARFSSVSSVFSAKNEYQLAGFGTGQWILELGLGIQFLVQITSPKPSVRLPITKRKQFLKGDTVPCMHAMLTEHCFWKLQSTPV